MTQHAGGADSGADSAAGGEMEERSALFTSLSDRLLQGEALDDEARRAYLLRLLSSLMPSVDSATRQALIERITAMPSPPTDIALYMAMDDPTLAAPLLRHAPFTQQELIELITRTGPEHHIEIAKRADLTLDVWLALARAAARRVRGATHMVQEATPVPERRNAAPGAHNSASAPPAPDAGGDTVTSSPAPREESDGTAEPKARNQPAPSGIASSETPAATRRERSAEALLLDDPDAQSWRFETDRDGRLVRLSPNAEQAFGRAATSLMGEDFAGLMQAHAAAPAADELGWAMRRRTALRDIVIETLSPESRLRRWVLRGQPRFSFPDGRFQGYAGTARDSDSQTRSEATAAPQDPQALLDRLVQAADRLARHAATPELQEYAQVMRDYAETLKTMPQASGEPVRPDTPRDPNRRA